MNTNPILQTELHAGIATITLHRPEKRNALNEALSLALLEALQAMDADASVDVIILQGQGPDFCAGADRTWITAAIDDHPRLLLKKLFSTLNNLKKPSIALAQGHSYGGGIGLLACCDIAIASLDALFRFPEVSLGLTPAMIAPYCIKAMGQRAAHYYFLTTAIFNADKAQQLGLIQSIVEPQALYRNGLELAKQLQKNHPEALRATKQLLRGAE